MRKLIVVWVVIAAFAAVPVALADSSTALDGYGSNAAKPVVQVKGTTSGKTSTGTPAAKPAAKPAASSSGPSTLPFTGADLVVFMVAGIALVSLGFGLRRLGKDES
jgi:hypothetical protein